MPSKHSPKKPPGPHDPKTHKAGKWRVRMALDRHHSSEKTNRPGLPAPRFMVVTIKYDGRIVHTAHGHVAYQNAVENVNRWSASGYVPREAVSKVMADYDRRDRREITIKNAEKCVDQPDLLTI